MNIDLFLKQALYASNKKRDGMPLFFYKATHPQPHMTSNQRVFQASLCLYGTNNRLLYVRASADPSQESFVVVSETLQNELEPTLNYLKTSKDIGIDFNYYFAAVPTNKFI